MITVRESCAYLDWQLGACLGPRGPVHICVLPPWPISLFRKAEAHTTLLASLCVGSIRGDTQRSDLVSVQMIGMIIVL